MAQWRYVNSVCPYRIDFLYMMSRVFTYCIRQSSHARDAYNEQTAYNTRLVEEFSFLFASSSCVKRQKDR